MPNEIVTRAEELCESFELVCGGATWDIREHVVIYIKKGKFKDRRKLAQKLKTEYPEAQVKVRKGHISLR